jgi:probable HAF family extracellular repeat protein
VVGVPFGGSSGSRAFLWQDGVMTNLDDLVRLAEGDRLLSAQDIDAGSRITGRVLQLSSGKTLAFVATPTGDRHQGNPGGCRPRVAGCAAGGRPRGPKPS